LVDRDIGNIMLAPNFLLFHICLRRWEGGREEWRWRAIEGGEAREKEDGRTEDRGWRTDEEGGSRTDIKFIVGWMLA
jgi:hypothetical protein